MALELLAQSRNRRMAGTECGGPFQIHAGAGPFPVAAALRACSILWWLISGAGSARLPAEPVVLPLPVPAGAGRLLALLLILERIVVLIAEQYRCRTARRPRRPSAGCGASLMGGRTGGVMGISVMIAMSDPVSAVLRAQRSRVPRIGRFVDIAWLWRVCAGARPLTRGVRLKVVLPNRCPLPWGGAAVAETRGARVC